MIRVVAGGRKNTGWILEACSEYEKRLRKPYEIRWEFFEEEKLNKRLKDWPFSAEDFIICCDERGDNISSNEFSQKLEKVFLDGREVVILIGGAYGFSDEIRKRSNLIWSFSRLVFPHMVARLIAVEQIYRAQEIARGGRYHHE